MAFQKFEKNTSTLFPTITITKSHSLGINRACIEKFFKDAVALELYYDNDTNRIGLKPFKKAADHLFSINKKEGQSASISCRGLIKHFGIEVEKTIRFHPAWNEKEKLLEIHLDKPLSAENIQKANIAEAKAEAGNSKGITL